MMQRSLLVLGTGDKEEEVVYASRIMRLFSIFGWKVGYSDKANRPDVLWVINPDVAGKVGKPRLIIYDDRIEHKNMHQMAGHLMLENFADVIIKDHSFILSRRIRENSFERVVAQELAEQVIGVVNSYGEKHGEGGHVSWRNKETPYECGECGYTRGIISDLLKEVIDA